MHSLSEYIFIVKHKLPDQTEDKRLPETCQVEVNKLNTMSAEFPASSQLLRRLIMPSKRPEEAKHVSEAQYKPLKSALQKTLGLQGWTVTQKSFIAGVRSLNEQDLHDNLAYFKVPQAGIHSIRSKLSFKIIDEYANILKGMYSTRFNGRPKNKGDHDQMDSVPDGPSPPLITSSKTGSQTRSGVKRRRRRRALASIK
jgi:hypothetical protein